jgi:hypothetical protein
MTKKNHEFRLVFIGIGINVKIKLLELPTLITFVNIHADFPLKVKYFIKIINFISTYKGTGKFSIFIPFCYSSKIFLIIK